jgi:hypothetical protein
MRLAFATTRRSLGKLSVLCFVLTGLAGPGTRPASAQELPSRQVTLFGIMATPGSNVIDPQLKTIAPELRKYWPNHGFKLLEVQSRRLTVGQSLTCSKLAGFAAETSLLEPLDINGKVKLQFALGEGGRFQRATIVTTPPNQPFFFDKPLPNGARLLIGVGAR